MGFKYEKPVWIPDHFYINGREWTTVWMKAPLEVEGVGNCYGYTEANEKTISLEESEDNDRLRETWIHELLHAVFPPGILSYKKEEQIVSGMAGTLARALCDSKISLPPSEKIVYHRTASS